MKNKYRPKYQLGKNNSESTSLGVNYYDPKLIADMNFLRKVKGQPTIGKSKEQDDYTKKVNSIKKKNAVKMLPNAQMNGEDILPINPDRTLSGQALPNTRAARNDKFLEHAQGAMDAAGLLMGAGALGSLAKKAIGKKVAQSMESGLLSKFRPKPTSLSSSVENVGRGLGNYNKILDKGLDIHDVRLKYHNNMILDFDEMDMLNQFGKGNKKNYEKALVEDIAGKMHVDDTKPVINQNTSKSNIIDIMMGTEQPKVNVPNKSILPKTDISNINPAQLFEQEQNIKIPPKFEVPSFYSAPYQRTQTSRAADKWLEDWFYNPETKKKFIDYGGTETEWENVLNSLENPIKSNYLWGKNQPGGVYIKPFDQASIPLNATEDIGVHEGIHKAKLLLDKNNPVLHRLWNDFTDAVRLTPSEAYPEIFRFRNKLGLKPGQTIDLKTMEDNLHLISDGYSLPYKIKDKNKLLEIINKAPAIAPLIGIGGAGALGVGALQQKKKGGLIKAQLGLNGTPLQGVTRKGNYLWEDNPDINAPYPSVKFSDSGVQLTPELGDMLIEEGSFSSMPGFDKFAARFNPANPIQKGRTSITPVTTSPPPKEKKEVWNPYMTLRGVTAGLSWLANKADRNRQDQYMYNQMSTLGQMNPANVNDYQPNPYNLYAQKGGSLKKYQQGGRAPIKVSDPKDPRLRAYNDSLKTFNLANLEQKNYYNGKSGVPVPFSKNPQFNSANEFIDSHYGEYTGNSYNRAKELNTVAKRARIKPYGQYTPPPNTGGLGDQYPAYFKKPVQPVVYQKYEDKDFETVLKDVNGSNNRLGLNMKLVEIPKTLKKKVDKMNLLKGNSLQNPQLRGVPQGNVELGEIPTLPYRVEYDGTNHQNFLTAEEGEKFMQELQNRPQGIPYGVRGYYEKKQDGGNIGKNYYTDWMKSPMYNTMNKGEQNFDEQRISQLKEIPLHKAQKGGGPFGLQNPRDIDRSMIIPNTNNFVNLKLAKEEAAMEINRRNKATNKRKFLNPTTTNTVSQEKQRLLKNKAYAATNPNVVMNQSGDLSRVNQDRDFEGNADNFMSKRQDKSYEHMLHAVDAAGLIMPAGTLLKKGIKQAGKYLTEQTALKNAYKYNPLAFKPNPEAYYRMIGKEGYVDALKSGVIRPPQYSYITPQGMPKVGEQGIELINGQLKQKLPIPAYDEAYYNAQFPLDKRWYPENFPKFNKQGKRLRNGYEGPYMAEVNAEKHLFENGENVAAYTGPNASNTVTYSKEHIPITNPNVKFYKEDWLKGYKKVPKNTNKDVWWNGKGYQSTPPSSQEVISISSGMDAVLAKQPGYNSHLFKKQGYIPPTTDPRLMATQGNINSNSVTQGNIGSVTYSANPSTQTGINIPNSLRNIGPTDYNFINMGENPIKGQGYAVDPEDYVGGLSNPEWRTDAGNTVGKWLNQNRVKDGDAITTYLSNPSTQTSTFGNIRNKLFGSKSDIGSKSEIDWSKWNSDIPNNKTLMSEYNTIEKKFKADGTWMKNPDGSAFQGTPEQFVQQNSKNFKKAFPNGYLSAYRGSQSFEPTLTKSLRGNSEDQILFGATNKETAESYASNFGYNLDHLFKDIGKKPEFFHPNKNVTSIYTGYIEDVNPGMYEYAVRKDLSTVIGDGAGDNWRNVESNTVLEWLKNKGRYYRDGLDFSQKVNKVSTDDMANYMIKNKVPIGIAKRTKDSYGTYADPGDILMTNSKVAKPKSLRYNNGMFDMTNPNIYKSLLPISLGLGAASQIEKKKTGGIIKKRLRSK